MASDGSSNCVVQTLASWLDKWRHCTILRCIVYKSVCNELTGLEFLSISSKYTPTKAPQTVPSQRLIELCQKIRPRCYYKTLNWIQADINLNFVDQFVKNTKTYSLKKCYPTRDKRTPWRLEHLRYLELLLR